MSNDSNNVKVPTEPRFQYRIKQEASSGPWAKFSFNAEIEFLKSTPPPSAMIDGAFKHLSNDVNMAIGKYRGVAEDWPTMKDFDHHYRMLNSHKEEFDYWDEDTMKTHVPIQRSATPSLSPGQTTMNQDEGEYVLIGDEDKNTDGHPICLDLERLQLLAYRGSQPDVIIQHSQASHFEGLSIHLQKPSSPLDSFAGIIKKCPALTGITFHVAECNQESRDITESPSTSKLIDVWVLWDPIPITVIRYLSGCPDLITLDLRSGLDSFVDSKPNPNSFAKLRNLTAAIDEEKTLDYIVTNLSTITNLTLKINSGISNLSLPKIGELSQLKDLQLTMDRMPTLQTIENMLAKLDSLRSASIFGKISEKSEAEQYPVGKVKLIGKYETCARFHECGTELLFMVRDPKEMMDKKVQEITRNMTNFTL